MNQNDSPDTFEVYEAMFDPLLTDRQARRQRKPRIQPVVERDQREVVAELAEADGLESGFNTTYTPSRYEVGWLLSSVSVFYEEQLITDILAQVRGGKEASVYRCAAHSTTGVALLAAKVYRPRMFRSLRNDKVYRQGREILDEKGRPVNKSDHRLMRAIGKKTALGVQVEHTSWLMHEYNAMRRLYAAGGAVPKPFGAAENAILMTYCGDERMAAPTLNTVSLGLREAEHLFREVLRNVDLFLQHGLVHGDLSAYNILYWQGQITLIDFPQVVEVPTNRKAKPILGRDIERVCDYFASQGVDCDPDAIVDDLWRRYGQEIPLDPPVPESEAE